MKQSSTNHHVLMNDKPLKPYPNQVQKLMLDATEDTNDYLVLEYLVQQAWKYDCDLAEVDLRELANHYELSIRKVRAEINKLIEKKVLIPTDYDDTPDVEFRVPLLTPFLPQLDEFGLAA